MRLAITIGRRHGSDTFETVSGPDVPAQQQVESFRAVCRDAFHPHYADLRLINVDEAPVKRVRLPEEKTVAAPVETPTEPPKPESKPKKKRTHETV